MLGAVNTGSYMLACSHAQHTQQHTSLPKLHSPPPIPTPPSLPNLPIPQAFNKAAAASPVPIDSLLQNRAIVQQVVYYHIVKEVVSAPLPKREFQTFVTGRTLTGDGMTIKGVGSSAQITQSNIKCGSGLAQVINSVLLFVNVASLGR